MKILQIIQRSQLRGAEIFACQLSEALQNMDHQVDVLILFGKKSDVFHFPLSFYYLEANEEKRWLDFKGYKKLHQFIKKGNYDIVQANAGDTLKYATLSKKIFGWKNHLVFRNANKIGDFLNTIPKKLINKWLMKEVDFIASVSKECMDDFIDCFPKFKNKIACLPIGAKILHVEKNEEKPNEIELLSKPRLLHVGGFVPEKNHKGLLNIFSKLLIEIPTANLLLVGEGKLKDKIISLANELNIEQQVHFLGKRNDVNQLMKYSDVFVMPSLIEGLPGVILESFSNYLPVIAYDTGGIKEIVINNKTGWLIKKNDEADFLQAIKFSVNNDSTEIVNNAINLLKNEYSIETVAKKFESSYHKIVTE